jgi:transcription initiation factor TFIID subunit 6
MCNDRGCQDAKKFMRHSFRNSLSAEDINSALRLRNMEVLHCSKCCWIRAQIEIPCAIQLCESQSLFGYSSSDPLVFRKATSTVTSSSSPNAGEDVYYLQDKPIKLDEYLAQPLPHSARGAPQEPTFSVHWLAIEGVQPRIPQNPLPAIGVQVVN